MTTTKTLAAGVSRVVGLILGVVGFVLATGLIAPAQAAELWKWEHWGVAPFAASREEAMAQKAVVLKKLGYPEAVQSALLVAMEKPGIEVNLDTGYRFVAQMGKGGVVHGLEEGGGIVAFKDHVNGKIRHSAVAERWQVTVDGVVYTLDLPTVCQNFTRGLETQVQRVALQAVPIADHLSAERCPQGYTLIANAWDLSRLPSALRGRANRLITEAEVRDSKSATDLSAYEPGAFSRTLGGQLRREVQVRAPLETSLRVFLLNPVTGKAESELSSTIRLSGGVGRVTLTREQTEKVVETVWPGYFKSPANSGGARRLRLYPREWGSECTMNVHGAIEKIEP